MKLIRIGKRILIGITLIGATTLAAYRVGTYDKENIYYHNSVYQEVISNELAYIADYDDSDVGVNSINDPPNNETISEENLNDKVNNDGENIMEDVKEDKSSKLSSETPKPKTVPKKAVSTSKSNESKATVLSMQAEEVKKSSSVSKVVSDVPQNFETTQGNYNDSDNTVLRSLMNEYRIGLGLSELVYDPALQNYANIRAEEISRTFGHTRPNGEYAVSYNGPYRSEIIANGGSKPSRVLSSWKLSSSHNEIMISTKYSRFAVSHYSIKTDTGTKNYWVTIFA